MTSIVADWELPAGVKRATVNLASVKATSSSVTPIPQTSALHQAQNEPDDTERADQPVTVLSHSHEVLPRSVTAPPRNAHINENPPTPEPDATAHGRKWDRKEVTQPLNGSIPKRAWRVQRPDGQSISFGRAPRDMKPLDYFLLMFPPEHLLDISEATTRRLQARASKPTSPGELLRFFGILVLMTRVEFGERRSLWSLEQPNPRVQQVNLSSDMSRHRFDELLSHISFSGEQFAATGDRWSEVEGFVDAINAHRRAVVTPAETICVDESISRWYGLGGDWTSLGLPHYVKLERKPESGCEIKTACCGASGILLALEITKSAAETATRQFERECQHGTATVLRLLEPWFHTNRHACADSFFASVHTALELWERGFRFTGVVKTATRMYPMGFLSTLEMGQKGEHNSMVSRDDPSGPYLMALCWLDRDRRYFISTTGTTNPATPIYRERPRNINGETVRVEFEIPIPDLCKTYYDVCSKIDRHNRCRQDDLNLEKKLRTMRWSTRLNTSLLSMCIVDSWLLYKGSCGLAFHKKPWDFYNELSTGLLNNSFYTTSLRKRQSVGTTHPLQTISGTGIHLSPTTRKRKRRDGTETAHSYQGNCCICKSNKKSRHYCSECLLQSGKERYICNVDTGRRCFEQHLSSCHDRE